MGVVFHLIECGVDDVFVALESGEGFLVDGAAVAVWFVVAAACWCG
jgi:hypothetical protein